MLWIIYCGGRSLDARESLPSVHVFDPRLSTGRVFFWNRAVWSKLFCFDRDPSLRLEESFSLTDRRLSSDSHKPSSGEVSPYDNNSPVLSDRLRFKCPQDSGPLSDTLPRQDKLSDQSKDNSGSTSPSLSTDKGEQNAFQH